jgi:inner membrane protein involved in colicin E2 resistance
MKKTADEFNEFDRVMTGLLSVPYSELQRKLEEEKREKEKQKERRITSSPAVPSSSARKKRAG